MVALSRTEASKQFCIQICIFCRKTEFRVTNTDGLSSDVTLRVRLHLPTVTEAQCQTPGVLHWKKDGAACSTYKRCRPLGKLGYGHACDYECTCPNADCTLAILLDQSQVTSTLGEICEICAFEFYSVN